MPASAAAVRLALPSPEEYDPYYERYVMRIPEGTALERLVAQQDEVASLFAGLPDHVALHRYAPGKWSVKEVVGHLSDTERIFAHRGLRFARADATPLPGFDENAYVPVANFDRRELTALVAEWRTVRAATLGLFDGLDADAWERHGSANGVPVSVRALCYIIAGHADHHLGILRERYGVANR